jgi:hypothetical protein
MQIGAYGAGFNRAQSNQNTQTNYGQQRSEQAHQANQARQAEKSGGSESVSSNQSTDDSGFDVDSVARSILGFVRTRVESAANDDNKSTDPVALKEMALEGVQTGFDEAVEVLSAMGKLTPELEDRINNALATVMEEIETGDMRLDKDVAPQTSPMQALTANQQMYANSESLTMSLQTKDGDTIELNISRSESSFREQLLQSGNGFQSISSAWELNSSSQLQFSVKGDLSEEELSALDSLLGEVQNIADKFFNEEYDQAFNLASELGLDKEQFSSLDLNMRETTTAATSTYQQIGQANEQQVPKGLFKLAEVSSLLNQGNEYAMAAKLDQLGFMQLLEAHPDYSSVRGDMIDKLM